MLNSLRVRIHESARRHSHTHTHIRTYRIPFGTHRTKASHTKQNQKNNTHWKPEGEQENERTIKISQAHRRCDPLIWKSTTPNFERAFKFVSRSVHRIQKTCDFQSFEVTSCSVRWSNQIESNPMCLCDPENSSYGTWIDKLSDKAKKRNRCHPNKKRTKFLPDKKKRKNFCTIILNDSFQSMHSNK